MRWASYLEGDVTHGFHPLLGGVLLGGKHVRLVVGLHAKGRHVLFGTGLRQRGQDGDALGQADDLFVQLPGFLTGPASRAPTAARASARRRVEKLEAGDAVLAGGVQNEPVLLPFLPWKIKGGDPKSKVSFKTAENKRRFERVLNDSFPVD